MPFVADHTRGAFNVAEHPIKQIDKMAELSEQCSSVQRQCALPRTFIIFVVPVPKATQLDTVYLAKPPFVDGGLDRLHRWIKPVLFDDKQSTVRTFRRLDHFTAIVYGQRHRLFTEHVNPAFQGHDRMFAVKSVGCTYRQYIYT